MGFTVYYDGSLRNTHPLIIEKPMYVSLESLFNEVPFLLLRLFTVPYFFVGLFRYTASYHHGYLDFQMYRGGGCRGL